MAGPVTASSASHARRVRRGVEAVGTGRTPLVEVQRARLLSSTLDVLGERGASSASIAHIVARSGVSRRTFYELFDSREDCYLAAFDEALARAAARVLPAYRAQSDWRKRVRAGLTGLLRFLDEQPAMGQMLVVESLSTGVGTLERRGQVLSQISAILDEARDQSGSAASLPPLTADGVVGGVLSLIHMRMVSPSGGSLLELTNQLMSMIVLPYLGAAAARRELDRPVDFRVVDRREVGSSSDPFKQAGMRLTYRTVQVLLAIAEHPCSSNRTIGGIAEIRDQGQISKLLGRLHRLGLIANTEPSSGQGAPNAWSLTPAGQRLLASYTNHASA